MNKRLLAQSLVSLYYEFLSTPRGDDSTLDEFIDWLDRYYVPTEEDE